MFVCVLCVLSLCLFFRLSDLGVFFFFSFYFITIKKKFFFQIYFLCQAALTSACFNLSYHQEVFIRYVVDVYLFPYLFIEINVHSQYLKYLWVLFPLWLSSQVLPQSSKWNPGTTAGLFAFLLWFLSKCGERDTGAI